MSVSGLLPQTNHHGFKLNVWKKYTFKDYKVKSSLQYCLKANNTGTKTYFSIAKHSRPSVSQYLGYIVYTFLGVLQAYKSLHLLSIN